MTLPTIAGHFLAAKMQIIADTGLAKDALHVHIGLAAFILVRLVWRGRWGWVIAWIVALAGTLAGEYLDMVGEQLRGSQPIPDNAHWHDIWNTMLWPTVLLLIGPWLVRRAWYDRRGGHGARRAYGGPDRRRPRQPDPSGDDGEQSFEQA